VFQQIQWMLVLLRLNYLDFLTFFNVVVRNKLFIDLKQNILNIYCCI
jgi:hypothetical protein